MSYEAEELTPGGALVLLGVAAFVAGGVAVIGSMAVAVVVFDRTVAHAMQKARHLTR